MDIFSYPRIMIVGNNGSGKSFLAKELSAITSLPLIHLDVEFWRPNWATPSQEEWKRKIEELTSKEQWIMDGNVNHGGTMELRFAAADLVIFLDINRFVCLLSVIQRNGKRRTDTKQYQDEKFDRNFLRFCKGIWSYPKTRRLALMDLHGKYPGKAFLVMKGRRGKKKLLKQWREEEALSK